MTHNDKKKNQPFVTSSEFISMIDLLDKNIKIVITVFYMLKKLGEILNVVSRIWKI